MSMLDDQGIQDNTAVWTGDGNSHNYRVILELLQLLTFGFILGLEEEVCEEENCDRLTEGGHRRPQGFKPCTSNNFTSQSETGILFRICLFS